MSEGGYDGNNIFLDGSSSEQKGAEFAYEVSTCVTPSHNVYSGMYGRYLLPEELLAAQAIFRCDATNEQAFDHLLETKSKEICSTLAQDIAGNSFTGTVIQAVCLSALASTDIWQRLQPSDSTNIVPVPPGDRWPEDVQRGKKRQLAEENETSHALQDKKDDQSRLVVQEDWKPPCRIRGKTKQSQLLLARKPVKKRRGQGKGNKSATGKRSMATIAQKEAIFQALEKAKKSGQGNPYKEVEKQQLPGYFRGCTFASKWGKVREAQRWDLLVQTAPQICKKFKELPNSIRRIIQCEKLKHGESNCPSKKNSCLPFALKEVIEGLIMDRVDLGEEVTIHFVKSTILFCTSLWNENIESMRQMMDSKKLEMLQAHDEELSCMTEADIDKIFADLTEHAQQVLQPVNLAETDGALLTLG